MIKGQGYGVDFTACMPRRGWRPLQVNPNITSITVSFCGLIIVNHDNHTNHSVILPIQSIHVSFFGFREITSITI